MPGSMTTLPPEILFGVAYYAEYHQEDRLAEDLRLMVEAGINVIRVGESVWSTWEPRDGEFDLEWLAPVLDGAQQHGIRVIIGTPTYAVPPWLQVTYPEIAAERATGERIPWGARQEIDYSHPAFRFHAERVIRKILERYADHPAVIGFQVDNEPGLELLHNHGVFTKFVRELKQQYGDVETLNREWGLTYWSHRIADWSELWRPDGNTFPQYDLAWRRFQARITTDFIAWQSGIVREYANASQFVTTCLQYPRRGVDDRTVNLDLDIAAGNPYYGMQDHLDRSIDLPHLNYWTTSGVAGMLRQADRVFSSKQQRYLVTETNAQAIDASHVNLPPYPGQLQQAAFAFISRGAAMIEYWHWHSLPYGAETYWGGVLPHSLKPGRVYDEVATIGQALKQLGGSLENYEPDADVAVLWSNPSRYALQFMPPFATETGEPDEASYEQIVDAFHRGVIDAGLQARILHIEQARELGAAALLERFPVLVAAGVYITSDDDLQLLNDYAHLGGHLILGPRTAYADDEARARTGVAPAGLATAAGASYEEFSNIPRPVRLGSDGREWRTPGAAGTRWIDGLRSDGAEILATYAHPRFDDFAAVTTKKAEAGVITIVGTVPNAALASTITAWAAGAEASSPFSVLPAPVSVSSGTAKGDRIWFVFNWGWERAAISVGADLIDALTGEPIAPGAGVSLGPWDVRVFRASASQEATR